MPLSIELLPHIEKAMGFELYDHQKEYLFNNGRLMTGRANGKTTAYCIGLALSEGPPLDLKKSEDFSDEWTLKGHVRYSHTFFRNEFMNIRKKLHTYGFRVREVKGDHIMMGKKEYVMKQLTDMGYYVSESEDGLIHVRLTTNKQFNVIITISQEDVESPFIVQNVVRMINNHIVGGL